MKFKTNKVYDIKFISFIFTLFNEKWTVSEEWSVQKKNDNYIYRYYQYYNYPLLTWVGRVIDGCKW